MGVIFKKLTSSKITKINSEVILTFEEEYLNVLNYAISQGFSLPSTLWQQKQNNLIKNLKLNFIWQELDIFYNFYTDGDSNFAKINWLNPGTFQALGTSHEPMFTSLQGFSFNGSSSYLDTAFVPNSNGINFTLNDSCLFADQTNEFIAGSRDAGASNITYIQRFNGNVSNFINSNTAIQVSATEGFIHGLRRNTVSRQLLFLNGTQIGVSDIPPSLKPSYSITIGALNTAGVVGAFRSGDCLCFGIGKSLKDKENFLYSSWEQYKSN